MTITHVEHTESTGSVSRSHVFHGLQLAVNTLLTWVDRSRKRHELRDLLTREDRVFKDIGLQRHDVFNEAYKRFWQV
jgi:uncharacterized protein YjiS (DUF1127 family)